MIKSVRPVTKGMGLPKFVLKYQFGKANRPSHSYDEVVEKYRAKLENNPYEAPAAFSPNNVKHEQTAILDEKLRVQIDILAAKLNKWTENSWILL